MVSVLSMGVVLSGGLVVFGEEGVHPAGPARPEILVLPQQTFGSAEGAHVAVHDLLPPVSLLRDEVRALEHGDVLLHRGEAHVVGAGERRDRLLFVDHALHDVAPRGIGQRVEDPIDLVVRQCFYNHLVVR
ncbi:hypothetical protein GCM10025867_00150 [Frondihabitans sucicola]|uniref:Secreted protein n=1 Tax=Frondihabitans sucicola TaxID=1268041 RepID=A0ABN6XRZ7_9MICO|nr:hypothetical protein GCM10025867_00150 [Frondihabitans sucicola]